MVTILFQGDSITDGNRYKLESQRWDLNHQIGHCYVYPIAAMYGAQYPEMDFRFVNRGVSGNSIWELKERWKEDTLSIYPDILSILIGTNDVARLSKFDNNISKLVTAYEETYNELLYDFKSECPMSKIVIIEPFRLLSGEMLKSEEQLNSFNILLMIAEASKRVAKANDAIFIPMQERFNNLCRVREPKYWIWDSIHPTESGHGIIAKAWMDAVKDTMFESFN